MNLPAQFLALRERFIARLPERLEQLRVQLEHPDALKRLAHSLVGAAGLHNMEELAHGAAEVERLAAGSTKTDALEKALDRLAGLIADQQLEQQPAEKPSEGTCRIGLLFQSDEEMRSQAALLTGTGCAVQRLRDLSGIEAAVSQGRAPDLLLMGLQFAGDDRAGLGILEKLKQGPGAAMPVIVLSASPSVELRLAAYRAGAERVLAKPVSPQALARHVTDALSRLAPRPLDVLLLAADDSPLLDVIRQLPQPGLALDHFQCPESLFEALSERRPDAILVDHGAAPIADASALIALIRDHPGANHTPIVAYSAGHSTERGALWQSGCAALIGPEVSTLEFGHQLAGLCQTARRSREAIGETARYLYEHARQRQALDHHAIITLADDTGTIWETSQRHQQLTGFSRTELIGASLSERRPGLAAPEFDAAIMSSVRQGRVWQGEYALPTRDGRQRWVNGTLVPFLDRSGRPYRFMVVRTDITERKLGEQALLRAHQREMKLAAQIQDSLLVPPLPRVVGGVALTSRFTAAAGVAGDFHALIEIAPGVFDVLLGDVMGKGVPAALIAAGVKMTLNQCLLDLRAHRGEQVPEPAEIIDALHQRLCPRLIALDCFVTLVYARFDRALARVTSVGCGHPEMLLLDGHRLRIVANKHPPLGTLRHEHYTQTESEWAASCQALLYSDGLSETRDADDELLGQQALHELFREQRQSHSSPVTLTAALLEAVNRFGDGQPPEDDRTLVAVVHPAEHERHLELPAELDALERLRGFVAECTELLPQPQTAEWIKLAAVEAFTNIVRHGQLTHSHIVVSVRTEDERLAIGFHYDGPAPQLPEQISLPDPEHRQESGYGLPLIRELCSGFEHQHRAGSNYQQLVFDLVEPPHRP